MTAGPIVLAAGGTGGHLFPAEALARVLVARGHRVVLCTDDRGGAYADRFPGAEVVRVRSATPSGRGLVGRLMVVVEIGLGVRDARSALRRMGAAAVVGFGGYPSLPTMWAALRYRVPTVIHEQNAVLGRVNKLLAHRVDRVALSLADTHALAPEVGDRAIVVGNPVRPAILSLRDDAFAAPEDAGPVRLLVTGGSQGARIFSEIVPEAIGLLPDALRKRLHIVQQARAEDLDAARQRYAALGIEPRLEAFIRDMPEQLRAAHLCIARSGASTVAELAVAGRPAILVPYQFAMDDHQTANAEALARHGGARVLAQADLTAAGLARELTSILATPGRLAAMAEAAHKVGRPDAAERLADVVEGVAGLNGGSASADLRRAA